MKQKIPQFYKNKQTKYVLDSCGFEKGDILQQNLLVFMLNITIMHNLWFYNKG